MCLLRWILGPGKCFPRTPTRKAAARETASWLAHDFLLPLCQLRPHGAAAGVGEDRREGLPSRTVARALGVPVSPLVSG